ncbi:hypothetical protein RchiOBHm_Chr1g0341441 [Rosa chinensis]|uniref:Uncharacterized protein n=1 Tax=Rosa chinensis TaxID=74649 RepID=A0A2P6SDR5_ROSCH|nr:hypothetical protein RchiOBHm_Chr1g0341441 [Rosa chinensis]
MASPLFTRLSVYGSCKRRKLRRKEEQSKLKPRRRKRLAVIADLSLFLYLSILISYSYIELLFGNVFEFSRYFSYSGSLYTS